MTLKIKKVPVTEESSCCRQPEKQVGSRTVITWDILVQKSNKRVDLDLTLDTIE